MSESSATASVSSSECTEQALCLQELQIQLIDRDRQVAINDQLKVSLEFNTEKLLMLEVKFEDLQSYFRKYLQDTWAALP